MNSNVKFTNDINSLINKYNTFPSNYTHSFALEDDEYKVFFEIINNEQKIIKHIHYKGNEEYFGFKKICLNKKEDSFENSIKILEIQSNINKNILNKEMFFLICSYGKKINFLNNLLTKIDSETYEEIKKIKHKKKEEGRHRFLRKFNYLKKTTFTSFDIINYGLFENLSDTDSYFFFYSNVIFSNIFLNNGSRIKFHLKNNQFILKNGIKLLNIKFYYLNKKWIVKSCAFKLQNESTIITNINDNKETHFNIALNRRENIKDFKELIKDNKIEFKTFCFIEFKYSNQYIHDIKMPHIFTEFDLPSNLNLKKHNSFLTYNKRHIIHYLKHHLKNEKMEKFKFNNDINKINENEYSLIKINYTKEIEFIENFYEKCLYFYNLLVKFQKDNNIKNKYFYINLFNKIENFSWQEDIR